MFLHVLVASNEPKTYATLVKTGGIGVGTASFSTAATSSSTPVKPTSSPVSIFTILFYKYFKPSTHNHSAIFSCFKLCLVCQVMNLYCKLKVKIYIYFNSKSNFTFHKFLKVSFGKNISKISP